MIPPRVVQKATVLVAVFAVCAVALTACGLGSPEKLMASAKDYIQKRDYNAAIIELKNVLQSTPNNGEARLLIGEAYLGVRDPVSAEKELRRALELGQPHEKAVPPFIRALIEQGKYDAVIVEVEKRSLFNPAAVAATRTALGDAHSAKGNLPGARAAYEAAVQAVPGYPRARLGEAVLLATEGRLDDALKQADEVIAADPRLAEARSLRADILLAKGDRPGAKKALEEAVANDGSFMPARLSLIRLAIEDREFDTATKLLNEARTVAPRDLRVTYYDATLALRKGELEAARQQVQQVLKFLPDHVPSLVLAGSIELQLKQFGLAEEHLRQVVARVPSHLQARRMLAATQLQMGQPVRARETLRPIVENAMPKDPQLLLIAGETYLANGDVKRASSFFQAASTADQTQGLAAKTRLGQIALATGRADEGFKELEAVSELDVGQYQADLAIITGHLRRNDIDKAMAAVQSLEKKQPKNPLTFQMYGVVHLAKKDLVAARRNFEKALELQPNYLPAAKNLGQLDLVEKRPQDARKRYEAMIAKEPKNDQLYLALAEFQVLMGADIKETGQTLQRAVDANPQSVEARLALINFHLVNRDAKAALSAAQAAVAAMPGDPRILNAAGTAQEATGEINQAVETYKKLATLQPQVPQPLLRLAALHARLKETDKAVEALRRVQRIAPRGQNVVPQLVQVYLAGNRPDDALKEARELQKREPQLAIAHALEGEIHMSQSRPAEAERAFRAALKVEPAADVVAVRLYEVLTAEKKTAEADAFSKKWMADNPKIATMRLYLGERELAAGNLKVSAAHYQAAIGIDPNNALALNNLAWISGELGDRKALEYAERAIKLAPFDPTVLDTYGMLLVKKGEAAKGLSFLEQARTVQPNRLDFRLNYAKALIKANRKDDARKELEALSKVTDQFPGKNEIEGLLKSL